MKSGSVICEEFVINRVKKGRICKRGFCFLVNLRIIIPCHTMSKFSRDEILPKIREAERHHTKRQKGTREFEQKPSIVRLSELRLVIRSSFLILFVFLKITLYRGIRHKNTEIRY